MKPRYRVKRIGDKQKVTPEAKKLYKAIYKAKLVSCDHGLFIFKEVCQRQDQ